MAFARIVRRVARVGLEKLAKNVHIVDSMLEEPQSPRRPAMEGAQSLRRAVAILRALAAGQASGAGLQSVAHATGLTRPTVHRMLRTLLEEGLVERHPRSRRYLIGEQIPLLALARPKRHALLDVAEAFVDEVAREVGDTAFLTIRTGDDTLCLARRMGGFPIQVLVIDVGARRPLGVSSAGLAILSRLEPEEAETIIVRNAPRLSSYRVSEAKVLEHLRSARATGYFCSDPGLVPGTRALSVPILGTSGVPLGALTVAAVRQRLKPSREAELRDRLSRYCDRIAAKLARPSRSRAGTS